jgi:hypothetical protein
MHSEWFQQSKQLAGATGNLSASESDSDSMASWITVEMDMFEADVLDFGVSAHESLTTTETFTQVFSTK